MKIAQTKTLALLAVTTALLTTACGGGKDDDAGSLTTFSVVPAEVTFTGGVKDACPGPGGTFNVYVYGGAAPYRIDNTIPALVFVNKTTVGDRGGFFIGQSLGPGCPSGGSIVVVDNLDRRVEVQVTFEKGS